MTHPVTVLSSKQQNEVKAFQFLPVETQNKIVAAIDEIFTSKPEGERLSSDLLSQTGSLDIAAACFGAELLGIDWR